MPHEGTLPWKQPHRQMTHGLSPPSDSTEQPCLWNSKWDFNHDFLISENHCLILEFGFDIKNNFLISEMTFWDILISEIRISDIRISDIRKSIWNQIFSCDQAALWMVFSVRLSVCPSHLFHYVPIIVSSWNFQELSPRTRVTSMQKVKVRGQRSRSQRSQPNLTVSGL